MIARVFAIAALLLVAAVGAAAAQDGATIAVEGVVLDGTAGGHVGPGLPVFLVSSAGPEHEIQAVTDEDGGFRFDSPPPPPGERLGVSIQYQGAVYGAIVQVVQGLTLPHDDHGLRLVVRREAAGGVERVTPLRAGG